MSCNEIASLEVAIVRGESLEGNYTTKQKQNSRGGPNMIRERPDCTSCAFVELGSMPDTLLGGPYVDTASFGYQFGSYTFSPMHVQMRIKCQ